MFCCEQCTVWQGRKVEFASLEEAEDHAERVHSNRLLMAYRSAASRSVREAMLTRMLRARTE